MRAIERKTSSWTQGSTSMASTAATPTPTPTLEDEFGMEIRDAPPAHLLIEPRSFSESQKHQSREYFAGAYHWNLTIYPNGREMNKEGDHISVYLCVANTDALPEGWGVKADCSILVKNQISNNYFCFRVKGRRFDALNLEWGLSISKRMLPSNGYLVQDKCVFGAEVYPHETIPIECLSLFEWKIPEFSKLEAHDFTLSDAFLVGGLRWKLKLYPKGYNDPKYKDKFVSIYLVSVENFAPREQVKASFCIRIKNQLSHAHRYRSWSSYCFTSTGRLSGFSNFIPIADMGDPSKGFLTNDCCFLDAQVNVEDVVYTPNTTS